jgi:hypothetical protein
MASLRSSTQWGRRRRPELRQIGAFPSDLQAQLDREFRCHSLADLERDPVLAGVVQGIVTRSNQLVPFDLVERLPRVGTHAIVFLSAQPLRR